MLDRLLQTEDLRENFSEIQTQLPKPTGTDSFLERAALYLVQGRIIQAQEAIEAANDVHQNTDFQQLCLFEQYDRFPDEKNMYSAEIFLAKRAKADYPNRYPSPFVGQSPLINFFNARLRFIQLRSLRSLLQGQRFMAKTENLQILYQDVLLENKEQFEQGDLFAGLLVADLEGKNGDTVAQQESLQAVMQAAAAAKDNHSMALCWMQLMDMQLTDQSSPAVWGFTMETSSSQGSVLPISTENREHQVPSADARNRARKGYNTALTLFKNNKSERGEAAIYLRFSYLYFLENEVEKAFDAAQQASQLFNKTGDFLNQKLAETHQVFCHILLGNSNEAINLAEEMATRGQQCGAQSWYIGLGVLMGRFARHLALRMGLIDKSILCYKIARDFQKKMGADYHAAQHQADIGALYKAMGMVEAAIVQFEGAADEIEALLDGKWAITNDGIGTLTHTRLNLAMLLSDTFTLGQHKRNGALMQRSVVRMGKVLAAIMDSTTEQHRAQLPQIQQVTHLYTAQKEVATVSAPLYSAKKLREKGEMKAFEEQWQAAKAGLETAAPGQRYYLEMSVYGLKRDWEQAKIALKNYLDNGGSNQGLIGELLAAMQAFGQQGEAEKALQSYRDLSLAFLSYVRIHQYEDAKTCYGALCAQYGQDWYEQEATPYLNMGDIAEMYEGLGEVKTAMRYYDAALTALELERSKLTKDEQKVAFSGNQNVSFMFTYAARAAIKLGQNEKGFLLAEAGKARGLLDLMIENTYFSKENTKLGEILRRFRALDAQKTIVTHRLLEAQQIGAADLGLLQAQLEEVHEHRLAVEAEIKEQRYDFFGKLERLDALPTFDEIKQQIGAKSLLLAYQMLGDDLMIWAVSQQGIAQVYSKKIGDWEILGQIEGLLKAIQNKAAWENQAANLSSILLEPFATLIAQYEELILVPHNGLHALPFQVLPFMGQPLGFQKSLRYAPCAAALQFLNGDKKNTFRRVLAVGNPSLDLPASSEEALFVGHTFGESSRVLLGAEATETTLRAMLPKADLVHFATHGHISESAPLQSSIALANGETLNLSEWMSLDIKAQLVVLSACDTGKGSRTDGDEVLSLTRGLIAAGAKAAVVSLWQVDDRSTALFMQHFYAHIKKGEQVAKALQKAQYYTSKLSKTDLETVYTQLERGLNSQSRAALAATRGSFSSESDEVSDGYEHPYYWAAFILVG